MGTQGTCRNSRDLGVSSLSSLLMHLSSRFRKGLNRIKVVMHSEFLLVGRKRLSQGDHEGQCLLLAGRQRELEHAEALVEVQVVAQGFGESILVGLPGQGFI